MSLRSFRPHLDSLSPRGVARGFHSLRATARTQRPVPPPAPDPKRGRRRLAIGAAIAVVLVGAAWAASWRERPREIQARVISGTPAKKITSTGQLQRWREPQVTVHVDRRVLGMGDGAPEAVERAFAAWSAAGTPSIVVEVAAELPVSMAPDGINAVVLAPITVPGHRNDLAVTIGFSDTDTGELVEADVIINPNYPIEPLAEESALATVAASNLAGTGGEAPRRGPLDDEADAYGLDPSCSGTPGRGRRCGERYDLESILAHEAGHFFGLGEDPTDGHATMFYCTSACETHKRSLEPTDLQAMGDIYVGGFAKVSSPQCSATPSRTPGSMLFGEGSLLAFLALTTRRHPARSPIRQRRRCCDGVQSAKERT